MWKQPVEVSNAAQVTQSGRGERTRVECLQAVLFQISWLGTVQFNPAEFFRQVHLQVGKLISAENFCVGLLSEDRRSIEFPYCVDAAEQEVSRTWGRAMIEYVIRHGRPLRGVAEDFIELARQGEIDTPAAELPEPAAWLGVPLFYDAEAIGVLAVQSYDAAILYGPDDQEMLSLIARQVSIVLHQIRSTEALRRSHAQLMQRVEERTKELRARNAELEIAFADLKQAQEHVVRSEKLASIGQLAAGVAHEINNPIGYVNSNLGALQTYVSRLLAAIDTYGAALTGTGDPSTMLTAQEIRRQFDIDFLAVDLPQLITESREGIGRVCKIVRDLKDFSRRDRNEAWEHADIHQGLESTLNIVANELKYKAHIVKTFTDLPPIECIPSELNQVFMNILMNAGQAISKSGIVTVSTGRSADNVWVAIGDDGEGIPEEVLPRIFDPFFTTKPVGTGTGLGLSISYGIVAKHHGRIEISSVPQQGTLVRIELPIEQPRQ